MMTITDSWPQIKAHICKLHCEVNGFIVGQGKVVQKPVNANPGLKVNQSINFSCLKMFFTAYVLGSLRLFKPKTEG